MKFISENKYGLLVPSLFNMSLANEKNLVTAGKLNDNYYLLYSVYYYYLEICLSKFLDIEELEKKINEDQPNFVPVEDKDKDIYQSLSNNKYFYIRNTLYVEKLSLDDIKYLLSLDGRIEERAINIISNTFKDVITSSIHGTDLFNVSYGPNYSQYRAYNKSLVLGFRVSDLDEKIYGTGMEWLKYKAKKDRYIESMKKTMEYEFSTKLHMNTRIMDYSEGGIIKKKTKISK